MNWNYPIGVVEYLFVFFFVLFYVTYIIRTIRVARQLKTTARTLIIKLFLRCATLALLLISLLGPSFGEAERELSAKGKDIYLIVDLSRSMDAADVNPSRLEKVKFELNHFIHNQKANKIGIIVFSNEAYVQVPLTYDLAALELFIQSLQTELLPTNGTNLCGAAQLAFDKLTAGNNNDSRAKMMIMFTDGETKNDCSRSLYNNIRRFGVGVYVVGVGSKSGINIPYKGAPLKDEDGNIVISKLDESFLQSFASNSLGHYYELNNAKNNVNQMMQEVNSVEGTLIDLRTITVVSNKYFYFLGAALVLLIMDVLITIGTFRL